MDSAVQQLMGSTHRLVVFDAIVRTGSFTQAAVSLGVSQPAISRQIAILEDHLQSELFRRDRNRVTLTSSGEALHAHVREAFAELQAGVQEIRGRADDLTLAVQPAIADSWFSPRLASLREAVAPTALRLVIYDYDEELASLDHDVSVRFGNSFGTGLRSEAMVAESVGPVAAPQLAAEFDLSGASPSEALLNGPALLRLDRTGRQWLDWFEWFAHFGHAWTPPANEIVQRSYGVLVQQALSGRGVVLGWHTVLGDLVSSGMLVPVGPEVKRDGLGYHLVWPSGLNRHDGLRRLRRWTAATIATF